MRWSLSTSLVLHAAILVAALFVLPNPNKYDIKPQQAIEVDISKIGDVSKRMAMTKAPETPKEQPAQKKTETVKKAEPAPKVAEVEKKAVVEAAAEPPPPEPKKDEAKPLDPDPLKDLIKDTVTDTPAPEKKKEEAKKKEEPKKPEEKPAEKKKKPEKKKAKLDINQLEAFLNKADESQAPAQPAEADTQVAAGEANLQGSDAELSATIIEAFSQKLRGCWRAPPGARESDFSIQIRFRLTMDGMLEGQPEVLNHSGDQLFEATARSALSALVDCQAYDFLPKDRYDLWQDNTLNFNPNMMASG